jgi:predicted RNA-binding Zn-ribbon protein involved in translation (DUF1610 family)
MLGCGLMTMGSYFFPFLCETCHRLVMVDLFAVPASCPSCGATDPIPYGDERLAGSPGQEVLERVRLERIGPIANVRWVPDDAPSEPDAREFGLDDGTYRCPECGKTALRFLLCGNWD